MTTRLAPLLLVLGLTLALPLAISGFLRGGHVTVEQALLHHAAIAERGVHVHDNERAGRDHAPAATTPAAPAANPTLDAGPSLMADPAPQFAGWWFGLLALALIQGSIARGQHVLRAVVLMLASPSLGPSSPPPRTAWARPLVS